MGGDLVERFLDPPPNLPKSMKKIAIVGLGYVGLPLSLQFAKRGTAVVGLDVDSSKINALCQGTSFIRHIAASDVSSAVGEGLLDPTTDFSRVSSVEAVIICVPTPLNKYREPDLSYVLDTGKAIAPHLRRGTLVVLESTTYPGTTEKELREVLEAGSGLVAGKDCRPRRHTQPVRPRHGFDADPAGFGRRSAADHIAWASCPGNARQKPATGLAGCRQPARTNRAIL